MMKGKGLVPLLVIALILVGLVIWKKTSTPTRTLSTQVELVQLLPEDLEGSDIGKLELYSGAIPDEKVALVKADTDWRVESHFNAPVAESKIDEYLEALEKLQGEFREEAASTEGLVPFDLTDETAFHVVGYKKDAAEPAFHLLVGKAADYRTVFMRASDQNTVYVEDTNLRQLAGVYGEDTAAAPTATPWLNKTVLELDTADLSKVEIATPDKTLVFEKQEPEPQEPSETPEEGEEASEDAVPEPEPEAEWVLASGGPAGEVKKTGIDNLIRKLGNLSASDVVDPANKAEYGLESPGFKATLYKKEGDPIVIEGGRATEGTDAYVRVASSDDDRVYKLDSYTFGQVFPKGSALFTLQGFSYPDDAIDRIAVTQPEGSFTVVRSGDTWTVESPSANLPVQTSAIDTLESMVQLWKPEDYADSVAGTGLENPARTITFSVGGDENVTLAVGDQSKNFDGYYAMVQGQDAVLAMSKTDYQKAFIEPKNLYQLKLTDATASELQSIAIERPDDDFTLTQTDGDWAFSAGPTSEELDQDKASDLASALVGLQASGIITGEHVAGTPIATIRVTAEESTTTYLVEAEQDGRYPMTLVEKNQAVWVEKADLDKILVASASLVQAPEPEAAAEPTTDEAAPPAAIAQPDAPAVTIAPAAPDAADAPSVTLPTPETPSDGAAPAEPANEEAASETPAPAAGEAPATEEPAPATAPAE